MKLEEDWKTSIDSEDIVVPISILYLVGTAKVNRQDLHPHITKINDIAVDTETFVATKDCESIHEEIEDHDEDEESGYFREEAQIDTELPPREEAQIVTEMPPREEPQIVTEISPREEPQIDTEIPPKVVQELLSPPIIKEANATKKEDELITSDAKWIRRALNELPPRNLRNTIL